MLLIPANQLELFKLFMEETYHCQWQQVGHPQFAKTGQLLRAMIGPSLVLIRDPNENKVHHNVDEVVNWELLVTSNKELFKTVTDNWNLFLMTLAEQPDERTNTETD